MTNTQGNEFRQLYLDFIALSFMSEKYRLKKLDKQLKDMTAD